MLQQKAKKILKFSAHVILFGLIGIFTTIITFSLLEWANRRFDVAPNNPPIVTKPQNVYYINKEPVVRVYKNGQFNCSGVVIATEYILTAAHCVSYVMEPIEIRSDKDNYITTGSVAGLDDSQDIALIHAYLGHTTQPAKVDFTGEIGTRNPIWVQTCGFPAGQATKLCTEGILNGNYYFKRVGTGILYQGMSGGPVYDSVTGVVIGVNSAVNALGIIVGPTVGVPEKFNTEEVR